MVAMLGPVSTWEDRGVAASGTLPNDWYTSRELFDLEQRTLFREIWHCVGRVEQVAEPGQYFVTEVADEQVVVVRGRDGELRALSNVCLHRAGPVAVGCGKRNAFQCPYHGWTFELDGRVRKTQGMDGTEDFEPERMRLPRFQVGTWGPTVWVALEPAVPLDEWLGDVTPRLANYGIDEMRFAGGRRWTIGCNWKMYVDNYMRRGTTSPSSIPAWRRASARRSTRTSSGATPTSSTAASRTRAAPAPGSPASSAGRRSSAASSRRRTASTSPSARATTSTGSSR